MPVIIYHRTIFRLVTALLSTFYVGIGLIITVTPPLKRHILRLVICEYCARVDVHVNRT